MAGYQVILIIILGLSSHGINLNDLANTLIKFGVVNAVNLDGGGSTIFIKNNEILNYPSDGCGTHLNIFKCDRNVSTITCIY
jgi:exopolysaccharide biosynthesis protein